MPLVRGRSIYFQRSVVSALPRFHFESAVQNCHFGTPCPTHPSFMSDQTAATQQPFEFPNPCLFAASELCVENYCDRGARGWRFWRSRPLVSSLSHSSAVARALMESPTQTSRGYTGYVFLRACFSLWFIVVAWVHMVSALWKELIVKCRYDHQCDIWLSHSVQPTYYWRCRKLANLTNLTTIIYRVVIVYEIETTFSTWIHI